MKCVILAVEGHLSNLFLHWILTSFALIFVLNDIISKWLRFTGFKEELKKDMSDE